MQAALQTEGDESLLEREVSVLLTDNREIHELNRTYRGKDEPTDVLAFALDEAESALPGAPLGDVVISVERATEQAARFGHDVDREVCFLAIHGTLHLLGYDHMEAEERKLMRSRERESLRAFGLNP